MSKSEIAEKYAREIVAITSSSPYSYKVLAPIVERAIAESQAPQTEKIQPPLWGTATVREDEDNGVNYWYCEICNEECDVKELKLTLRAEHFKVGTVVDIYEPGLFS